MEHHVYFWLKEERKDSESCEIFEKGLKKLFRISYVEGGSWGNPAKTPVRPVTNNTWDYALSLKFASQAEHDLYQDDPLHDEFVEDFKEWWADALVMDLEEKE